MRTIPTTARRRPRVGLAGALVTAAAFAALPTAQAGHAARTSVATDASAPTTTVPMLPEIRGTHLTDAARWMTGANGRRWFTDLDGVRQATTIDIGDRAEGPSGSTPDGSAGSTPVAGSGPRRLEPIARLVGRVAEPRLGLSEDALAWSVQSAPTERAPLGIVALVDDAAIQRLVASMTSEGYRELATGTPSTQPEIDAKVTAALQSARARLFHHDDLKRFTWRWVAVLEGQRTVVHSGAIESIVEALQLHAEAPDSLNEPLRPLDGALSADLEYGGCTALPPLPEAAAERRKEVLARLGLDTVHPYVSLAVATTGLDRGRIVISYDDAAKATADREPRLKAMREGSSVVTGQPLADLFTVLEDKVEGSSIVVDVRFDPKRPTIMRDMLLRADTVWASCASR